MSSESLKSCFYLDKSTGEVIDYDTKQDGSVVPVRDLEEFRVNRYISQSVVRQLLPIQLRDRRLNKKKNFLVRTHDCLRTTGFTPNTDKSAPRKIEIVKSIESDKAHYSNLTTCNKIHYCPCCRARLDARRAAELQGAMDRHLETVGNDVLLATFTFPHELGDDLFVISRKLKKTFSGYKSLRATRLQFEKIGETTFGSFTTTEYTYGSNGWHPHIHMLIFVNPNVDVKALQLELSRGWQDYAFKKGLGLPSIERGVRITSGKDYAEKMASYMCKLGSDSDKKVSENTWSLAKEVTYAGAKKSFKGMNPFQILTAWLESTDEKEQARYKALYCQYAEGTIGLHVYDATNKLKEVYLNDYKSDEDLAAEKDENVTLLGYLNFAQWARLLNQPFSKKTDHRIMVLFMCERGGIEAADLYIKNLPEPKYKSKKQKKFFESIIEQEEKLKKAFTQLREKK